MFSISVVSIIFIYAAKDNSFNTVPFVPTIQPILFQTNDLTIKISNQINESYSLIGNSDDNASVHE